MEEFKIVILGEGGVGKSAITVQFLQNKFSENYDPTIQEFYQKNITVDNQFYRLEILDTAGQEEYISIRDSFSKDGDGYILVYDLTNLWTFNQIEPLINRIYQNNIYKNIIPIIICGNKLDLNNKRQVSYKDGLILSEKLGCKFIECSAKTYTNVDQVWHEMVREIIKIRNPTMKKQIKGFHVKRCEIL